MLIRKLYRKMYYMTRSPKTLAILARVGIPLCVSHIQAVTLEMTNACNLRCPVCPVPLMHRKTGFMVERDFQTIMTKLSPSVKGVRLNYAGEPLLHDNVFRLVKTGKEIRPDIVFSIATNATLLGRFDPREIVESRLDVIFISIDGATKQTHEMYRVGSSFEEITQSVKKLCEYKRKLAAKNPIIVQQSLLFKESVKEISQIEQLAQELGVDELALRYFTLPTLTCDTDTLRRDWHSYSEKSVQEIEMFKEKFEPPEEYSLYERNRDDMYVVKKATERCSPFPFIMWNGDVTVCCHDPEGEMKFGNLVRESWKDTMGRMSFWKIYTKQLPICRHCDVSKLGVNYRVMSLQVKHDES